MTPANIRTLAAHLDEIAPDLVKIVRADHFFCLYNKAHGMAYNLCLEQDSHRDGDTVSFGAVRTVTRVRWTVEEASSCGVMYSLDGSTWTELLRSGEENVGFDIDFSPIRARWIKITCGKRVNELAVFGK